MAGNDTSHAGCRQQQFHFGERSYVAIESQTGRSVCVTDNTRFELRHKTLLLNAGDVLCFDGDLEHAGAAYDKLNTRVHVYLDSPESAESTTNLFRLTDFIFNIFFSRSLRDVFWCASPIIWSSSIFI